MLITVFGAGGRTGFLLVSQALDSGYQVRAFSRNPDKISTRHSRLTTIQGDITRIDQVKESIQGAETVLSVLGPTRNSQDLIVSRGTENIILAMEEGDIRRLIVSAGAGVPDAEDRPTFIQKIFGWTVRTFSTDVYDDMAHTVALVRGSDLDWTIVRVPRLNDGPQTGRIRVGYLGNEMGTKLDRADLAAFMLEQIRSDRFIHKAPVISN